ncbi:hypothetical protein [Malacoplasma muris]|uniref:hypothetical protein n=1 Tax=Malacoplasma muris TaxID=2119 RepID=UPI00398EDD9A
MSSSSSKKEILQLIIRKKVVIENNYFTISSIIDDIIKTTKDDNIISLAKAKQSALDNAINFAVSQLEILIQNFINSLQSFDAEKHKEIEKQLQKTIDQLNLKTRVLTEDLSKAQNIKNYSNVPSDNAIYGTLDNVPEKDVNKEFGKKSRNEIKDLRQGVLIESLNDPSPRELSIFDDMYFDEVQEFNEYKKNKNELETKISIKDEFEKMEGHSISDQLLEIENKLMNEINKLKVSNQLVSDTNDTLLSKIKNEHPEIMDSDLVNKHSFDMLDVAINDMISKIELTKIPDYKNHDIKNLEDISQTLVKSLEANIENLSKDIKNLKEENKTYRDKMDEYISTISDLKNDRLEREKELNESYIAWVSSNKKLQDLEILLGQQSIDISDLDGQKNIIIDTLEKKLKDTISNLNIILSQNEELINRQEELEEFIRLNEIKSEYTVSAFEKDIEAKSLQDLVEKETNKIVEIKLSAMISRYKEELDLLENKVKENIEGINTNKDILSYEFDKQSNHTNEIKDFQDKIDRFENKVKLLEEKLIQIQTLDRNSKETIESINDSLGYEYVKNEIMDNEVSQKLKSLEQMLNDTMDRLSAFENKDVANYYSDDYNVGEMSQEELDYIIKNSDIYNDIRSEIVRLENQVNVLKSENIKIKRENYEMTTELDDSFQKFAYNTNKMKQVEELLNSQVEEFEKLNVEKDELIAALESKVQETIDANNQYYQEEYYPENQQYQEYNEYNESLARENIELLVDKRVNELLANKALDVLANNNNSLSLNNLNSQVSENHVFSSPDDYPTDFISNEDNKDQVDIKNFDPFMNNEIDDKKGVIQYNSGIDETKSEEFDFIPVEQSFESNGYTNEFESNIKNKDYLDVNYYDRVKSDQENKEKIVEDLNQEKTDKILPDEVANDRNELSIEKDFNIDESLENAELKTKLINLQEQYNLLLKELENKEPIIKEKIIVKEIKDKQYNVPKELLENTERLKNFERLLIQIDNEISNLENDSLNKFLNAGDRI